MPRGLKPAAQLVVKLVKQGTRIRAPSASGRVQYTSDHRYRPCPRERGHAPRRMNAKN